MAPNAARGRSLRRSTHLLTLVNTKVYYCVVTARELRKLLKANRCTFKASGHDKVYLGNRMTVLPRHDTDIGPYLFNKILKDLGIEKEKK
jgi:hypothetical protein